MSSFVSKKACETIHEGSDNTEGTEDTTTHHAEEVKSSEEEEKEDHHNHRGGGDCNNNNINNNFPTSTRHSLTEGRISLSEEEIDYHTSEFMRKMNGQPNNNNNNQNNNNNNNNAASSRPSMVARARSAGSSVLRRVSNISTTISEYSDVKVVHEKMEKLLDTDETEGVDYDWWTMISFIVLEVVAFILIISIQAFPTYVWTISITGIVVFLMISLTKVMDTTTRGERVVHVLGMTILLIFSSLGMILVTSSCSHCMYRWACDAMASSQDFSAVTQEQTPIERLGVAWELLLGQSQFESDDDANKAEFMTACRKCVSSIFVSFLNWKLPRPFGGGGAGDVDSWHHPAMSGTFSNDDDSSDNEETMFNIQPYQNSESMFGDMAAWYFYHNNKTLSARRKTVNQKFAKALSIDGHLRDSELTDILEEFLCSQASRVDNPDPNIFLSDLKRPRFTGEKGLNISAAKLQSIMRGDILKELGVSLCFNLRFALFVPNDVFLEKKAISYTQLFPIANEEGMKAFDRTSTLPFLVTPGFDQDIDIDGSAMKRLERLVDIFVKFPFQDKPVYFETREEYYAFYRWELESTIQDGWYFPQWFLDTEKAADFADFMATKLKSANDHLTLVDPYSDRTLGDRCFYGTGQEFLTPVKFPGLNADYEFSFPNGPQSFMTDEHREMFRYANKPSPDQLLRMIYNFWPKEARKGRKIEDPTEQLARFKNRMLQIDYASWASIDIREDFIAAGCILYLDPKTKLPMGLWESHLKHLYLPNEPEWEHAKYYYRVMERVVLATRHVIESHFTWSHPLATASWQTLSPTHGLRTLVKPYTLHVHSINWAAYHMLARNHSVLNHASGFTQKGYTDQFMEIYKDFDFSQTIPEAFESRKLHKVLDPSTLPYYNQGLRLWDAHREFVENFVHLLFPTDRAMLEDKEVIRFWHHVNTYGRHLDPCVCGLGSDQFFDGTTWPGFEKTHTCVQLLDHIGYGQGKNDVIRRRDWCSESDDWEKVKAMRKLLESECGRDPSCNYLPYGIHSMRANMGLPELKTRSQLIDYIATVIWNLTAGHKFLSDNLSYFADPEYSGVRMRDFGPDGRRPRRIDVGSYVFATSIASLTTVRTPPLLADWTPLYSHYAAKKTDLCAEERKQLFESLDHIHKRYKFRLLDLSREILNESLARPVNHRWNTMNPATHASSVAI